MGGRNYHEKPQHPRSGGKGGGLVKGRTGHLRPRGSSEKLVSRGAQVARRCLRPERVKKLLDIKTFSFGHHKLRGGVVEPASLDIGRVRIPGKAGSTASLGSFISDEVQFLPGLTAGASPGLGI